MYKLLPEKNSGEIRSEYSLRRVVVMLVLVSLALVFTVLAALPSLIHGEAKKGAAALMLESAKSTSGARDRSELEKWVGETKLALQALAPGKGDTPYESFRSIIEVKPSGVRINGFSWQKVSGAVSVRVRGVALDRQALLSFQDTLKDSPEWQDAELPVSTLAADRDIEFELTLRPK